MKIYFSSDTHYFHDNIIKYCSRPFQDAEEMNNKMIENWNAVITEEDVVFHIGDFSAGLKGRTEELRRIISSLAGKKVLIRGNHDHLEDAWYIESGFVSVHDIFAINDVLLSHMPVKDMQQEEKMFVVHGHIHRTDVPNFDKHFNVAVDRNNFAPVPLEVVIPLEMQDAFIEEIRKNFCQRP